MRAAATAPTAAATTAAELRSEPAAFGVAGTEVDGRAEVELDEETVLLRLTDEEVVAADDEDAALLEEADEADDEAAVLEPAADELPFALGQLVTEPATMGGETADAAVAPAESPTASVTVL